MAHALGAEPFLWLTALAWLACIDPALASHFTLCPLKNLGIPYCPGCGLGRSVSFMLHGDVQHSIQAHILGIPAIVILVARLGAIITGAYKRQKFLHSLTYHKE